MNCFSTDAHNFRLRGGTWLVTVCLSYILLVSFASGRPSDAGTVYGDDYSSDVSDELWGRVKENSTSAKPKVHNVVYYKEDYVNENFDPTKAPSQNATQKYKQKKPEKVYFDYYPNDEVAAKSNEPNIFDNVKVEVISLNKDEVKHLRRRQDHWRDVYGAAKRRSKRDVTQNQDENTLMDIFTTGPESTTQPPHLRHQGQSHRIQRRQYHPNIYNQWPNYVIRAPRAYAQQDYRQELNHPPVYQKYAIRGIYYNPITVPGVAGVNKNLVVGSRFGAEDDRVVWDVEYEPPRFLNLQPREPPRPRPSTTRRPPPPLIHAPESEDEDARPATSSASRPQRPQPPPLVHATEDEYEESSSSRNPVTERPQQRIPTSRPVTSPPRRRTTPAPQPLTKCVWAIVSCCSKNSRNVKYRCFEQMGCQGNFWDLDPCADHIQDKALEAANNYFD